MDSKIVSLTKKSSTTENKEQIIKHLEKLLEKARNDEITFLATFSEKEDGYSSMVFSGLPTNPYKTYYTLHDRFPSIYGSVHLID